MDILASYTPQTRRLRRIAKDLLGSEQPRQHAFKCLECHGELAELPRSRVFINRTDGQRYRCVLCRQRHLLFMGELLTF